VDGNSLLAGSTDSVGLILFVSASVFARTISSTGDVGIVAPSRPVCLGLEGSIGTSVLHVVQVTLGTLSVGALIVESVQSHLLARPFEVNHVPGADLQDKMMTELLFHPSHQ